MSHRVSGSRITSAKLKATGEDTARNRNRQASFHHGRDIKSKAHKCVKKQKNSMIKNVKYYKKLII